MISSAHRGGLRRGSGLVAGLLAVLTALALSACSSGSSSKHTVAIVGYSVPKPAYDALSAAFAKTDAGQDTSFSASYGPSGTQSKAVASGQHADYVAFSLQPDMDRLVPKYVDPTWSANTTKGMVSDSVVVIVVRKGNPKHITGWNDLIKPDIKIVTADPASSGSAKWNVLAAYEHVIAEGGTEDQAKAYLTSFFGHVISKPTSGAIATTTFLQGTGDVLISYEDEAISTRAKGGAVDYLVPDQSVLIENPAAVTKTAPQQAKDFLAFALSAAGQQVFAAHGFRPVVPGVASGTVKGANDPVHPFPTVPKLVTIASLGGWSAVNDKFFDSSTGIVTKIEGSG
jgi:ABC-type sulfate transport system substrate-binding protein